MKNKLASFFLAFVIVFSLVIGADEGDITAYAADHGSAPIKGSLAQNAASHNNGRIADSLSLQKNSVKLGESANEQSTDLSLARSNGNSASAASTKVKAKAKTKTKKTTKAKTKTTTKFLQSFP